MGKKDKKKGKGAEKTEAKTKKKLDNKLKKELAMKGEEDIENILAKFVEETARLNTVTESAVCPPSKRSAFSFVTHPDKDQLILFGGEYFNGTKTFLYNDLYFYKIKQANWIKLSGPVSPPPRCSHQAVVFSQNGGEMWIFGGEFTSPSQSQFYHFKDLWVFRFTSKKWENVIGKGNGPSARSGHRMVGLKKKIFIFGGFRDNQRDYKYFNDVYIFDTEHYSWHRIEPTGNPPSPRSGCQMLPMPHGRILVYGGYSKEKVKKDVDRGITHTDIFALAPDKHDTTGLKWKWVGLKPSGCRPGPRCAFGMTLASSDRAVLFGGVDDTEDESELEGTFFNDLFHLDLNKLHWHEVRLKPKKFVGVSEEMEIDSRISSDMEELALQKEEQVSNDGIFTVSVSTVPSSTSSKSHTHSSDFFAPPERISPGLTVKRNVLYLYGGMFEDGDKQLTLNDFYSLDLNKLEEWTTLIPLEPKDMEWFDSDSGTEDEDESEDEEMESELSE